MLRYLGSGRREFGLYPMYVHRRANWEFFAVVQGRCGALLPGGAREPLRARTLWVFPPETAHGWAGERDAACRVVIFHFGVVPELLENAGRARGHLSVALTAQQARRLVGLAAELRPHDERGNARSPIVFERALLELSLLALESVPLERTEARSDYANRKVEAALTWYSEHMEQQPKLEQVAASVKVSVRHLRRLFQDIRREGPQAAFTRLRVQRAMELLAQTDQKLDAVAAACGFASSSDFCRVFKGLRQVSPDAWRRRQFRRYVQPGPPARVRR